MLFHVSVSIWLKGGINWDHLICISTSKVSIPIYFEWLNQSAIFDSTECPGQKELFETDTPLRILYSGNLLIWSFGDDQKINASTMILLVLFIELSEFIRYKWYFMEWKKLSRTNLWFGSLASLRIKINFTFNTQYYEWINIWSNYLLIGASI